MNALTFQWPEPEGFDVSDDEITVVGFAGMGGSCTGIEAATGQPVTIAMNHSVAAVSVHKINHPRTEHFCQNIWQVNPKEAVRGRRVGLAWFSPDCRHFSKAKGAKPVARNIRDLAWVVVNWAQQVRPRIIMLENVEEFRQWCPVDEFGRPVTKAAANDAIGLFGPDAQPKRKARHGKRAPNGETFEAWCAALRKLGYRIDWREMRSCVYGGLLHAATIRKRLYVVMRCDDQPIVWPEPKFGAPESEGVKSGALQPYYTAADCIDWSIPCPSIFGRARPLKDATCRRIAAGIMRYVVNNPKPFIIPLTHHGSPKRGYDLGDPLPTVTAAHGGEFALVEPFVIPITHTTNGGAGTSIDQPLRTVTTAKGGEFALVVPHVMTMRNAQKPFQGADEPMHTVTAGGAHQYVVAASLVGCGGRAGQSRPRGVDEPMGTTTSKADLCVVKAELQPAEQVAAFLAQHNTGVIGRPADEPVSTILQSGSHQAVVTSNLVKLRGTCKDGQATDEPMPTVTAGGMHIAEVRAFLVKYYGNNGRDMAHGLDEPLGTVTTADRFGLVTVSIAGEDYVIADIGMRMLTPRELARAQGFPESTIIDPVCDYETETGAIRHGRLPIRNQVKLIGNVVTPNMAEVLVAANYVPRRAQVLEAAE